METKQELPKWFDGELYTTGDEVMNPFTGQTYPLTAEELSMYDFIMGCNFLMENNNYLPKNTIKNFTKALNWFRKNNPEAYMVLLD